MTIKNKYGAYRERRSCRCNEVDDGVVAVLGVSVATESSIIFKSTTATGGGGLDGGGGGDASAVA